MDDEEKIDAPDPGWYDNKSWKSILEIFKILPWVIALGVGAFGVYMYQRDTNTQQIVNVTEMQRKQEISEKNLADYKNETNGKIDKLRQEMLTRELFEVYRKSDTERWDRMEKTLETSSSRP